MQDAYNVRDDHSRQSRSAWLCLVMRAIEGPLWPVTVPARCQPLALYIWVIAENSLCYCNLLPVARIIIRKQVEML